MIFAFLDVRYTIDLDTIMFLDFWTSGVTGRVDFKGLWGLFGKLIFHHFDWEPGVCQVPGSQLNTIHASNLTHVSPLGLPILCINRNEILITYIFVKNVVEINADEFHFFEPTYNLLRVNGHLFLCPSAYAPLSSKKNLDKNSARESFS